MLAAMMVPRESFRHKKSGCSHQNRPNNGYRPDQTDARKTCPYQLHPQHVVHKNPAGGGNRLTGVSTGRGGCAPHGARGPHLRIIVLYKYNIKLYKKIYHVATHAL